MADRVTETNPSAVPDIPDVLESALLFLIGESKEQLEQGAGITPRTGLVLGDTLVEEDADADTVEACYEMAAHTVQNAAGAKAYGFVYDGYIEVDDQTVDAIIAEGGVPGEPTGVALGLLYTLGEDGSLTFEDEPTYVGQAPNFMAELREHAIESSVDVAQQETVLLVSEDGAVEEASSEENVSGEESQAE